MNRSEEFAHLIAGRIQEDAVRLRSQWAAPAGTNTRHFVIDNLLPNEVAAEIYAAFPPDGEGFNFRESFRERKHTSAKLNDLPEVLGAITFAIQDPSVVTAVAGVVEWDAIDPDPMLYAGGLSMMFRDAFLNPHIDNSHDAERRRYRRLNLLYYVTPDWKREDGGNLELWDDGGTNPVVVESRFNRLVVMETNKSSLHSVSPVVAAGPRCCVSSYYFSEKSPDGSDYFHVTSFKGRPDEPLKRALGPLDNAVRQAVASTLKVGRGKDEMNR